MGPNPTGHPTIKLKLMGGFGRPLFLPGTAEPQHTVSNSETGQAYCGSNWVLLDPEICGYTRLIVAEDKSDKPDNKLALRPSLIIHAYLTDLADWGTFGKSKVAVAMRLIEDGVKVAIDRGDIAKRSARDFPDWKEDNEEP